MEKYVVFGASSTLGQSVIREIISNGDDVVGVLHQAKTNDLYNCMYFENCDCEHENNVLDVTKEIEQIWGLPNHIINVVGYSKYHDFINDDIKDWYEAFDINFKSAVNIAHFSSQLLIKSKAENKSIVFVGSGYGERHIPFLSPYCTSKAAIASLASVLSTELALTGIRINTITPGLFPSNMTHEFVENKKYINQLMAHIPDGKLGSSDDLAKLILFLTSPCAKHINGSNIVVDGGMLALIEGGIVR